LQLSDIELDIQRHELLRADPDAFVLESLEPCQLRLHGVVTGRDSSEVVQSTFIRNRITRSTIAFVDERDRHAGDNAAGIHDGSADATGEGLRDRRARGQWNKQQCQEAPP
jgi:hypothetical protein